MVKMSGWCGGLLAIVMIAGARAEVVWQPVTDYLISFPRENPNAAPVINPFDNFTHLGTDFGWMGPGENRIDAFAGAVRVAADGGWTGTWHSLAGLARETDRLLDPGDVLGFGGPEERRAKIESVSITATGTGQVRLELLDGDRRLRWQQRIDLSPVESQRHTFEVDAAALGPLKFLNWIVEPGSQAEISSLGFGIRKPEMSPEEWIFRVSLGKLRRCHDPASGLTRDRAHAPPGVFDTVPSSGMHALAGAVAAAEGILDPDTVAAEIRRTTEVLLTLPRAGGFLPHFTHRGGDGNPTIHPSTEFSTVDTAITLHALHLASKVLGLRDVQRSVMIAIREIDFDAVTDIDGWVSHGFETDGVTLIPHRWRDWGGETALVLAMEAMQPSRTPRARMENNGKVFRGIGFISEIQSLFYPDFDREDPDKFGVGWHTVRADLLTRQRSYFVDQWPDSPAARSGLFGVSAGEIGMPAAGYTANGVDMPGVRWMHPHAMIMGLAQSGGDTYRTGLERLANHGFLFPWGLPENIEVGLRLHNPMQGSLNASFEVLAAYHGWRRAKGERDLIDEASLGDPLMRRGAGRFYFPEG